MPDDLKNAPLANLATINPATTSTHLQPDDMVSFIPMSDVTETGQWNSHQIRKLREVRHGYTAFQEGDILFAKITPCMENGKGAHAIGLVNGIGYGTTEFHVLRTKPPHIARFIYHWLQSKELRRSAEARMIGSAGQQRVQAEFFEEYKIFSPSPAEQRRIAQILDTIDTQIQETEKLIAKLKQLKAGLLHDLLTKGIDAYGEVRDPVAHPEQFKESVMGLIPGEWEITMLGPAIQERGGAMQTGPFGSQLHAYEYVKEGIPVIMPQDIQDGNISENQIAYVLLAKANKLARHRVELNDVIFARRGDLSRCASISQEKVGWLCGTGCLLVRPPTKEIYGPWLSYIYRHSLSQRQILAQAVGSTGMVNLNTGILSSLAIAKPDYDEQVSIITILEAHDARIASEEADLNKLRQVKKGLMDDLLTGRVRVTELAVDGEKILFP